MILKAKPISNLFQKPSRAKPTVVVSYGYFFKAAKVTSCFNVECVFSGSEKNNQELFKAHCCRKREDKNGNVSNGDSDSNNDNDNDNSNSDMHDDNDSGVLW